MKKKYKPLYEYGGEEGKYKKVTTVPTGYALDAEYVDKEYPKRKYYKKTSGTSAASVPTPAPIKKPVRRTPASTTGLVLGARPRPKPTSRVTPKNTLQQYIDRVYTEPDEAVPPVASSVTPVKAFEGENIFMHQGLSNQAIGQAMYPSRGGSNSAALNTANQDVQFQYYKPNSDILSGETINIPSGDWNNRGGAANFADSSFINKYRKPAMAMGGQAWSGLLGQVPGMADAIIGMLGNNPNNYSKQPIVNSSAIRNMSPYVGMAYGGTIDDLDENELADLQAQADDNGLSVEEMFDSINGQQEGGNEDVGEEEFAMGGRAINVEDDEVVQAPGQEAVQMSGPTHEEGGIDMDVPSGTKVYSDRLEIDGKSMQQRKIARERRLAKLNSTFEKHIPTSISKNTMKRMSSHIQAEEQQDMQLQEMANKIYAPPQERQSGAYGGYMGRKQYGYGDLVPTSAMDEISPSYGVNMNPYIVDRTLDRTAPSYGVNAPAQAAYNPITSPNLPGKLGAGDYIGMAGTAFNAIAPIINTMRAKKHTAPVLNRFEGVGQRAIDANDDAQDYVAGQRANAMTDIDTSANASIMRNRNSARGVNTQRALDTITDIVKGKSRNAVGDTFSRQMTSLMGQRGQLTNFQDIHEAQGQTQADTANAMNRDNHYSNMAENLVNAGEGIQSIGKNLNVAKSNRIDANLISQLSRYGLEFDADGNLINKGR